MRWSSGKPAFWISIVPFATEKPFNLPSAPLLGIPVVSVALPTLIKPKPLPTMPFGLAITKSAFVPAISSIPFRFVLPVPVTSVRISFAAFPCKLALAFNAPANWELYCALPVWLLNTIPLPATLKSVNLLCDRPLLSGFTILIILSFTFAPPASAVTAA